MKQRIALWGALAVLAIGAVAIVVTRGGDDDPPPLRLLAQGASDADNAAPRVAESAAADTSLAFVPQLVAADDLPDMGGEAPAYQLATDAGRAEFDHLAEVFGIEGDVVETEGTFHVTDDDLTLDMSGSYWGVYRMAPDTPVANGGPGTFDDSTTSSAASTGAGSSDGSSGDGSSASVAPVDGPAVCLDDKVAATSSDDVASSSACAQPVCPDWLTGQEEPGLIEPSDPMAACEPPMCPDDTPSSREGTTSDFRCIPPDPGEPLPLPEPLPDPAPVDPAPVDPMPVPVDPDTPVTPIEGLPGEDEARQIAVDTLEATGVDLDGADIVADMATTQWGIAIEPRVGDLPAPGLQMYVAVGVDGRIENASGTLADPELLGDYPLVDTRTAIDRLNEGWGTAVPVDDPAVAAEGAEVATEVAPDIATDPADPAILPDDGEILVTDAELVLINAPNWDQGAYLVPGYRFETEDGSNPSIAAVTDDVVDARPSVDQDPSATEPGTGGGSSGSPGASETAVQVALPLQHCGFEVLEVDGQRWAALTPSFDATNAPPEYVGRGLFETTDGNYTDESGIVVELTAVDESWQPEPCD